MAAQTPNYVDNSSFVVVVFICVCVCVCVLPFSRELLSSDGLKEYSRARVYLDENYESKELFTVSTSTKNNIKYIAKVYGF